MVVLRSSRPHRMHLPRCTDPLLNTDPKNRDRARAPRVPRDRGSTMPEFIISGLNIAARANFESLVPARVHRIEGSRADFSITSLRVPVRGYLEIPPRAPS
jgi:hypothetical protein